MSIHDRTLIIDVTYQCNSRCIYCQWSLSNNIERIEPNIEHLMISSELLRSLKVKRVVFSGGEPILSKHIGELIRYYTDYGLETVVITNGLLMTKQKVSELMKLGLKGVTFSLDSTNPKIAKILRGVNNVVLSKILRNIKEIKLEHADLEVGINTTLTHYNVDPNNIASLLNYVLNNNLDFIKFQPVFDDGYVSKNAPDVILSSQDLKSIEEDANLAKAYRSKGVVTNPEHFWYDLYYFIVGKREIDPSSCGALSHQVILFRDGLRSCFWRSDFEFSNMDGDIEGLINRYKKTLHKCNVNFWCFCNQPIDHKWRWMDE